jgi:hypothetical protein
MVTELAIALGNFLMYIPPYSPNLNLIERFWKYTKSRLRSRYYCDFRVFKDTIDDIVVSAGGKSKPIVDKLIGEKVQLFDDLKEVTGHSFIKTVLPKCA